MAVFNESYDALSPLPSRLGALGYHLPSLRGIRPIRAVLAAQWTHGCVVGVYHDGAFVGRFACLLRGLK